MIKSIFKHSPQGRLGVALAVVFSIGVVAVASASAATPQFKGVSEKAPVKFSVAGAALTLETAGRAEGRCNVTTGSGTLTGAKAGTATLVLSQCGTLPGLCHTAGKTEELKTAELEVVPVYISKAEKRVAIEFKPKTGTVFAPLTCAGGVSGELRGTILAAVTPVNSLTTKFTLTFQENAGIQSPHQYENEKGELVNNWLELGWLGKAFEQTGWSGASTLTTEKAIEIEA